jgi:DNA-binding CsgD family transcriptional regulator
MDPDPARPPPPPLSPAVGDFRPRHSFRSVVVMGTDALHRSARHTLGRLARARMDNDVFCWEAAEVLRRAIGFDTWCWVLLDPASGLLTRYTCTNPVIGNNQRRFYSLDLQSRPACPPSGRPRPGGVSVLSAATGGALDRDPLWREMLGPAGLGDQLGAHLAADGVCWASLSLYRDEGRAWFNPGDAAFVASAAPLLAARLRAGLRHTTPASTDLGEPGTIIVDRDLNLVTATCAAWRWIARLGLEKPSDAEPLPGFIYAMLARLAHIAQPDQTAQVPVQAADGTWALVRAAPLTGPHVDGGYAITLQSAPAAELTGVLMPAWNLSSRERDVAALIIEGRSSEDIAASLFLSPHTVRDHTKAIFGKVGVHNRRHLTAALTGQPGEAAA